MRLVALCAALVLVAGCSPPDATDAVATTPIPTAATAAATTTTTAGTPATTASTPTTTVATTTSTAVDSRPDWLGGRPLPLRPDGFGQVAPTPEALVDRAFPTPDLLVPPDDEEFLGSVTEVPPDVLLRSTWTAECPVAANELAYVTVSHWGFDGAAHTGEMLVHVDHAAGLVAVFERLFASHFPIEEMRIIRLEELDLPPTGDGNVTTAFVCRPAVGSTSWSMHASGMAIDLNPFHNPYVKGDLVLPELASYYVDRSRNLPGMIVDGDDVVAAFSEIGWSWGGRWNTLKDWMHFSVNDR